MMNMKYKSIDISGKNTEELFFHYTNINNIDSIFERGLIPKIGKNANFIEKSKKVFFAKGSKGILVLMDVWIKWLVLRPKSDFIYGSGAYLMQKKWFPKIIIDILWKNWLDYIYSYDEGLTNKQMDYWNMHTITGKVIESSKIKIVKINDEMNANQILKYLIKNTDYDLEKLPFLNIYKNMFFKDNCYNLINEKKDSFMH